jgi:hypothetical protein
MSHEILKLDATAQLKALASGRVSASELLAAAVARNAELKDR